jgi:hypothetical protein
MVVIATRACATVSYAGGESFGGDSRARLWRARLSGRRCFGQSFTEESGRHGGGENRTISGLFDFEAVEERPYIWIRAVCADAAFGGVKNAEKGGGLLGDGAARQTRCR